jgi:hypothetical protein
LLFGFSQVTEEGEVPGTQRGECFERNFCRIDSVGTRPCVLIERLDLPCAGARLAQTKAEGNLAVG